jgi:hypothetical protein
MSDIRTIDFNALPRQARERLVACIAGQTSPAPILAERKKQTGAVVGLILLLIVLFLITLVMLFGGIGNLNSSGITPLFAIVFYWILFFLVLLTLFSIVRRIMMRKPFPYQAGRYVFPTDFVDARTDKLRIVPIRLVTDFKGVHMHTNGSYTHTALTFTFQGGLVESFSVRGQDAAQTSMDAFWESQRTISNAAAAQDWTTIERLDPFFEQKRTGVWEAPATVGSDAGPRTKAVPAVLKWRAAIAFALAFIAAPPVMLVRNLISDEMMFSKAKSDDTELSWERYRDLGWRHVDEAKAALPAVAFREAKTKGTVSAVRQVLKKYPGSEVEQDAKSALHAIYSKTLSDFRLKASTSDARMLPFMERLIAYLETADTATVRVVFEAPTAESLADADRTLNARFSGQGKTVAPISPYFDDKRSNARESEIVGKLNEAFGKIFPTDVMRLELSEKETAKDPTLHIGYRVGPSGDIYGARDNDRIYVGIVVNFAMGMVIPNDTSRFGFQVAVEPPEHFTYMTSSTSQDEDAVVYDTMATRAFDQFGTKLQSTFFKQ